MNKILVYLFSMCVSLTCLFPVRVSASIEDNNDYYVSNIEYLESAEKDVNYVMTFFSEADDIAYLYKYYNDKIEIYNSENNELINTVLVTHSTTKTIFNNYLPLPISAEDYESWRNYVFFMTDTLHWGPLVGFTVSSLTGLLVGKWASVPVAALVAIAEMAYNNHYEGVDVDVYISTNAYCPILVKEKHIFYNEDTKTAIKTVIAENPTWYGTPDDFTQPAACRILAQKY